MGKYQTKAEHDRRYDTIAEAEGEQCLACYVEKGRRKGPPQAELQIDHADGNRKNWAWKNLHLLCRSCNCRYRNRDHSGLFRDYSGFVEREREREGLPTWKTVLTNALDYSKASPELGLSRIFWPKWVKKATEMVEVEGEVEKKRLLATAGKFAGAKKQTSANYLETELYADDGLFSEASDGEGNKVIRFRERAIKNPFKRSDSRQQSAVRAKRKPTPPKRSAAAASPGGNGHGEAGALTKTEPLEVK